MYLIGTIFLAVGLPLALFSLGILILSRKSSLIFGKYPRKGLFYQLKYVIARLVLKHLRYKIYRRNEAVLSSAQHLATLDRPQTLTSDPKSYDCVSFVAANRLGEKFSLTLERRRRGVLKAALYLWLPDEDLLCTPRLPDMVHFTTDGKDESKAFVGSGFSVYPEQSMRIWRIKYNGELRKRNGKLITVQLDLKFHSTAEHFDYNRDLSSSVIADSTAREAWNDNFYNMLKNIDKILEKRTHYEQNGRLTGRLTYGDGKQHELLLHGCRDHSFGTERCLSTINRYVYFALFLDDGTHIIVGTLSQPSFFLSSLKVGYIFTTDGIYKPITSCNFELYSYGEKGVPPQHQNFIVTTAEQSYLVQIKCEESVVRFVGGDWESKVYNQFVSCTVNGGTGHGITEYLYRHAGGRPLSISCNDPEWYQRIKRFERSLSNMTAGVGQQAGLDDDIGHSDEEFFF